MNIFSLQRWAAWLSLLAALGLSAAAASTTPQIVDIQSDGTNVAVRIKVGSGTQRLTVEGRPSIKQGSWTPRANAWPKGLAGEVTVRFPVSGEMDVLRASSDDGASLPLPSFFYAGKTNFTPLVTASSPVVSGNPASPGAYDTAGLSLTPGSSATAVVESDIWKVDSNTVYFFNQYRGLQVIDITQPASPVLKATLPLADSGEQMYVLNSTGPGNAWIALVTRSSCGFSDSQIALVQVQNGVPVLKRRLGLGGSVVESRLIGNRLIAAAVKGNNYYPPYGLILNLPGTLLEPTTLVSSFDLTDPANPVIQTPVPVPMAASVVTATDQYFLLSGTVSMNFAGASLYNNSQVQVLDISDPSQPPVPAGSVRTAGNVSDKFKLNAQNGVLTAVSQVPAQWLDARDPNQPWGTLLQSRAVVETFNLNGSTNLAPLGQLTLVTNETLFGTRFDGSRLYVVTFHQIDPLWVVDLSSPTNLAVVGKLQVPGYSTFLQPLGSQLLTLGVVTNHVAASLFDVSDPSQPALLSRAILGDGYSGTEASWDEKAFSVYPDQGLILLPWWGQRGTNQWFQGIQLIDLSTNGVSARGVIARDTAPRRVALANPTNLVSISGPELFTAGIADRDNPNLLATLPLLYHVDRVLTWGASLIELSATRTESYAQLALASSPETPSSKVALANYPITGASINGDALAIFQRQYDNYHYDPIYTTNDVVSRVPQPPLISWITNDVLVYLPQPPITVCTQQWRTITFPPGPDGSPGYTTNYWRTACHDVDQPPIPATNTVVEMVKTPQPDLLTTNPVVSTSYTNWVEYGLSRMTRIDLSSTGLTEAGHWEGVLTNFGNSQAGALWISSNVVVWTQQGNYGGYPIRYLGLDGIAFAPGIYSSIALFPYYYNPASQALLAYDISQSTPQFLGETDLQTPANASFTPAYAADGKIFTGYQFSAPGGQLTTNWFGGVFLVTGLWAPWGNWETHYFLEVADYGDPANPVLRKPVELPGSLTGISHEGNLVYTLRNGWSTYGATGNELAALAYDGLAVSLVDTLPLTNTPPVSITASGSAYLARGSYGTNYPATLDTWAISTAGKWQQYGSTPSGIEISQLSLFNDLLAGSDGSSIAGFDLTNPLAIQSLGIQDEGCFGYNLMQADGNVADGLWIPRGDYGLLHVDFTTPPGN